MSLVLTYQIGIRWTVFTGGMLACLGFVLTRFTTYLYEVYITLGALVGKTRNSFLCSCCSDQNNYIA